MITVNFFTSEKRTQPVIEVLKKASPKKLATPTSRDRRVIAKQFYAPKNIKLLNIYKKLNTPQKADVFVVADFGEVIPKNILEMPKYGSLCLHPSLLPKYRGASPVQYAIMNGDKITGVTIFKMDEKIDHGPIISQFKEEIRDDDTQETLYERLFKAGAEVLLTILPAWVEGRIKPRPQEHSQATCAPRLKKEDGKIDWRKSDREIERFIRAMHPWPGAWTMIRPRGGVAPAAHRGGGKRLKILKAHLAKSIHDRPLIPIVNRDKLVIDLVQLEGKKPITWKQFLAGHPNFKFS